MSNEVNKILFAKRMKINGTDNEYLTSFVYDAKGRDNLHEPNYNLLDYELLFKNVIIDNMKKALADNGMQYISADFRSNMVKFKVL